MAATAGATEAPLPLDALRRIAFLLERAHADTYRVKAFRSAADAVLRLGEDDIAARHAAGTLREIPGIGEKTAAVVSACLEGQVPAYLAELESTAAAPLTAGGDAVRRALRGDLHLHSDWSDGGSPIEEMVATGLELGHEYLVLTDHSPRLKVANGLTPERLRKQVAVVRAVDEHLGGALRVCTGIEVDILEDGSLDQEPELLAQLDLRVASVHSKLRMERAAMTRRMIAAVENPHTNVLGHCTGRMVTGKRSRPQSDFDAAAVFAACAANGVAVEFNSRPERLDPPEELVEVALDAGCLFSIDSDAHAPGQLDWLAYGCERAERAGVPLDRIVNTWPLDRLLAWANDR